MNRAQTSRLIKEQAVRLGFAACGISRAEFLEEEARRLEKWLQQGMHGQMSYLERNLEKRVDPQSLLPGAKSVVSLLCNYFTEEEQDDCAGGRLSRYAYGKDYHRVVKVKLLQLLEFVAGIAGQVPARAFVDSGPILERAWAARSGLGWIGKNTCLIRRGAGSFYFLGELLLDLDLQYDRPVANLCAKCKLCIEACPTGAIVAPYLVDARKCISYLTIEYRGELPRQLADHFGVWVFGCDICQEVCPFNRLAQRHAEPRFRLRPELKALTGEEWRKLDRQRFEELFRGSAVGRAKYEGLRRNIEFLIRRDDGD